MTYQMIVSTMHQTDHSLVEKMNIHSDAIIVNQADSVGYDETQCGEYSIKWYTFNERGLGLSRTTGLLRSDADIVQFADDDMVFSDTYREDVIAEYERHPEADVILFSNCCLNKERMPYPVKEFGRVNRIEGVKFGGARITARREKLLYNNVVFSSIFGAGSQYATGEDTTFIQDCLKAGLRVYKSPVIVSTMEQQTSTWFNGYNGTYYKNKGALLARNFPVICRLGIYIQALKHRGKSEYTYKELVGFYREGIDEFFNKQKGKKSKA